MSTANRTEPILGGEVAGQAAQQTQEGVLSPAGLGGIGAAAVIAVAVAIAAVAMKAGKGKAKNKQQRKRRNPGEEGDDGGDLDNGPDVTQIGRAHV